MAPGLKSPFASKAGEARRWEETGLSRVYAGAIVARHEVVVRFDQAFVIGSCLDPALASGSPS
jgi:hypothetical protein